MRILAFTAGAAQMYCGSCLHDNAVAAALKAQGHDVMLVPLYTPTLTDDANVSGDHIFFGGISVYLEQHSAIFRHTPRWLDKLLDSRRALQWASKRSVSVSPLDLGQMTVEILEGTHGHNAKEIAKLLEWLATQPKPDIVTLPYTLLIGLAKPLRDALGCPVSCSLQGEDLFIDGLPEPWRARTHDLIRANIEHVDVFLPTSEYYARYMSDYLGIARDRMRVAPLGINLQGFDSGFRMATNCFTVGYFARIAPEKSLHLLADAYCQLRKETDFGGATLEAAGYMAPEHAPYLRDIVARMKSAGFEREFRYHGALDRARKIEFLRNLSVMSVPSQYREPKGLPVLEANAVGVPVIQPDHGAFPELIGKTGGGVLFEPGNTRSLAGAIYALWKDPAQVRALGEAGARGVREHYSIERAASATVEVLRQVTAGVTI